jgi:CBS domain containing-hemolysin-like protein
LFLAVSLLIFAWASVAAASRRQSQASAVFLARPSSPVIGILLAAAAAAAGGSALSIAYQLANGSPAIFALASMVLATSAVLACIYLGARLWGRRFPRVARRLADPRRWAGDGNRDESESGPSLPIAMEGNGNGDLENGHADGPTLTPAELMNLDRNDIDMVRSISHMDDIDVKDIMVPRLDVQAVEVAIAMDELVPMLVSTRHTRVPVYRDTMDNVIGIIHISDVLQVVASGQSGASVDAIMREPEFVAENMAVDDLLHLMRSKSLQMAIVVDEYGGVEGIVTLEDVLEEIVGEIDDEFDDAGAEELEPAADGSWLVKATAPVEVVARALGLEFDCEDVNTIGGYVYTQLGRMPSAGDVVVSDEASIEVTQVRGRRIYELRLVPAAAAQRSKTG